MRKTRYKTIYAVIAIISIATILCSCDQLPPTIEHGEFPFSLKYKLNEEIYEVKDTVICDFAGFDISGGFGKSRTWNEYLKSGRNRISILHDENVHSVLKPQRVNTKIEVYFNYGDGMYYMGDPNAKSAIHAKPHICYVEIYNESPKVTRIEATPLTKKQLKKYFDIEIIELSFSKPINNTFEQHSVNEVSEPDNNAEAEVSNNIDIEKVERVISNDYNSVFEGKIGTKKICMAIYRNEEQLTASYITPNEDDGEINLQGTIEINTASFILYNEDNDIFFTGMIKPNTEKGERLEGTYTSPKNEVGTPFSLALSYTIGKTFETRYPSTTSSTEDVEEFARKIKRYIIKDNKEGLAELIHYPINVTINDSKVSINNAEEFKQNYDDIINADFKVRISNSCTKYMNSNYMGIMLGYGDIWFDNRDDKGLRIIAINN